MKKVHWNIFGSRHRLKTVLWPQEPILVNWVNDNIFGAFFLVSQFQFSMCQTKKVHTCPSKWHIRYVPIDIWHLNGGKSSFSKWCENDEKLFFTLNLMIFSQKSNYFILSFESISWNIQFETILTHRTMENPRNPFMIFTSLSNMHFLPQKNEGTESEV